MVKSLKFYSEQQWDNQIYFSSASSVTEKNKKENLSKNKESETERIRSPNEFQCSSKDKKESLDLDGQMKQQQPQQITFNPLKQCQLTDKFQAPWVPLVNYKKQLPSTSQILSVNFDSQTKFYALSENTETMPCIHPKILLVDDDMFNILALQQILKQKNLTSQYANNGKQAIDLVLAEDLRRKDCQCKSNYFQFSDFVKDFSLILMDLNMPIMDGIEATKQLQKLMIEQMIDKIPIVGCSAYGQEKSNCLQLGMSDFLTKPLTAKLVQETIQKYLCE